MRVIRLYTNQILATGLELALDDDSRHYAFTVLRITKNSSLTLFNGDGFDYRCEIVNCSKSKVLVKVVQRQKLESESKLNIHLYLGVSKSSHMDYAIQKTVEAGVSTIQPVEMERTVIKSSKSSISNKHKHWQRIIQSACEQSGRAVLPCLLDTCELNQIEKISEQESGILFDATGKHTLKLAQDRFHETIKVAIGPEGGFTQNEISHMSDKGFQIVRCGPRIMRTETAALTAVVALQLIYGDLVD